MKANVNHDRELDEELAKMTDALIDGREIEEIPDELRDLEPVLRGIYHVVSPNEKPSPAYRARLLQKLNEEWDQVQTRRLANKRRFRLLRLATLAASITVALAAFLSLIHPNEGAGGGLEGTATGPLQFGIPLILALFAIAVISWSWLRQR